MRIRCIECGWVDDVQEKIPCPKCLGLTSETLLDIDGAEHLFLTRGAPFKSYYLFKTFKRTESLSLGKDGLTYRFNIFHNEIRFVIPSKVEIPGGIISYTDAERLFGLFRYPRNDKGDFFSPFTVKLDQGKINALTEDEVNKLLKNPYPLVFEAFRIPAHVFDYSDITNADLEKIRDICGAEHTEVLKKKYDEAISHALNKAAEAISAGPNYLVILLDILSHRRTDYTEVTRITDNILRIG